MAVLNIDAHCMDGDFEVKILNDYGVTITDRSEAPWNFKFEGPRDGLIKMVVEHWSIPEEEIVDQIEE